MKKIFFLTLFNFLLISCNSNKSINEDLSDLESLQTKTTFVDLDENNLDLSEFKQGKIVINYWATWCAPCIKEMPSLKRAEKILNDYGYTFLLVSDETISKISRFQKFRSFFEFCSRNFFPTFFLIFFSIEKKSIYFWSWKFFVDISKS